ncbi:MAG: hypothetical protein VB108_09130 [Anaerolineaceae bacterium]|nr:hypothetical protein [Anaerolineaceae bacterium]
MNHAAGMLGVLLPGLCWWAWLGHNADDPAEKLAGIFGVSISAVAVAALFFYLMKLPFGPNKQIAYWIGGSLLFLLGVLYNRKKLAFNKEFLLAFAAFAALCVWRLWQARELLLPNWVDSLHHSLIVRKMVEAGGLTASLEPYLPGNFYYHYGFHSFTALYSLFSRQFAPFAVLFMGQIISAGVSLSIYAFSKTLTKDWKTATLAALISAFVTKMPGYYLSWGRYTLLAGMLLMPLAMALGLKVYRGERKAGSLLALFLLTAGTLLTHYFNAFLLAAWFVALGLAWLLKSAASKKLDWKTIFYLATPIVLGLLVTLPWYWRIFQFSGQRASLAVGFVSAAEDRAQQWTYLGFLIGNQLNLVLAIAAGAGVLWSLLRKKQISFSVWALWVGLFSLPVGLQLSSFRHDYFGLILFFPISIMSASFLVDLASFFYEKMEGAFAKTAVKGIALAFMLFVLIFGGWASRNPINKATILVDQDDLDALNWIDNHLPADARFFINTAPWGFGLYRGVDGGAWITPYTGRWAVVPTDFYVFANNRDYEQALISWGKKALYLNENPPVLAGLICDARTSHLYIKEGFGGVTSKILSLLSGTQKLVVFNRVSVWSINLSLLCCN